MDYNARQANGEIAEQYVVDHFHAKHRVIYKSITDKAHVIDLFTMSPINKSLVGVEVKSQSIWRDAMGHGIPCFSILKRHWDEYFEFMVETNIPLHILVVDWRGSRTYIAQFKALTHNDWVKGRDGTLYQYPILQHASTGHNDNEDKMLIPVSWFMAGWSISEEIKNKYIN